MPEPVVYRLENGYREPLFAALDELGVDRRVRDEERIVLKPNLVTDDPPPTTTDVRLVEALVCYFLERASIDAVTVAEGSGGTTTGRAFEELGYTALAEEYPVHLVDLDGDEVAWREHPKAGVHERFPLPRTMASGFIVSVPVLKVHTMTRVTLGLKNMVGIAPSEHFGGTFNKSGIHRGLDRGIVDLNLYCRPDLTVLDAAVGQKGSHLAGRPCDPPVRRIVCGYDPVAVDIEGCRLLGVNPRGVKHIVLAEEHLAPDRF